MRVAIANAGHAQAKRGTVGVVWKSNSKFDGVKAGVLC